MSHMQAVNDTTGTTGIDREDNMHPRNGRPAIFPAIRPTARACAAALPLLFPCLAGPAALAQQPAADNRRPLEVITVTAQKRQQQLDDVSIAVTAFGADQLQALGIEESIDIIAYTPNVSRAGDLGGQRSIFNIRGVVQNDYADIAEAPVAVYIDGAYLASTQAQGFGMFDMDRVEILKGPQGTLFGRNATGGLVNAITAKPTIDPEGYLEMTAARFDQLRIEGAISGSISDTVRGRLSVLSNEMGEILQNIYQDGAAPDTRPGSVNGGEDGYNDDTFALRLGLDFDLGDNTSALLQANWADARRSEGPYQVVNTTEVVDADNNVIDVIFAAADPLGCDRIRLGECIDGNFDGNPRRPRQGGDFNGNIDPDGSGPLVNKDFAFDDQNRFTSRGLMLQFDYAYGDVDMVSISDYKEFTRVVGLDSDQTASPELIFQSDGKTRQYSYELRLASARDNLQWIGGLYYLDIETDYVQGLAASPTAGFLAGQETNTIGNIDTESWSLFGQADYNLTDRWVLIAGLRAIREDKRLHGRVITNDNLDDRLVEVDFAAAPSETADLQNNQNLWSAKLQLDYSPDDDRLYYLGIHRGVKAGSFNAPLLGGFGSYAPERLLSAEAGAKLSFLDRRLLVNAGIFHYDYDDYQSFSWVNNSGVVSNEAAIFNGAEIEIRSQLADGLDMMFNASYIDARVKGLEVADGIFSDTTPPFTPEFTAAATLRYGRAMFGGNLAFMLAGSWQSATYHNARNFTAHRLDEFLVADAALLWRDRQDKWKLRLYVDNLTDSDHSVVGFDVSGFYGTTQTSYARPRTYGLTIRRTF